MNKRKLCLTAVIGMLFFCMFLLGGCGGDDAEERKETRKKEKNTELSPTLTPVPTDTPTPTPTSIVDEPRFEKLTEDEKAVLLCVAGSNIEAEIDSISTSEYWASVELTWTSEKSGEEARELRQNYSLELAKTIGNGFPTKVNVFVQWNADNPDIPEYYSYEKWKNDWFLHEEFDSGKLINWNDAVMKETYGVNGIRDFVPADPNPRYYIIAANEVIDPVTGKVSEGGHAHTYHRESPISTRDLLYRSGSIDDDYGRHLVLTDDPNLATYVLILDFEYYDGGTFTFSEDNTTIPEFDSKLDATLRNMISGEEIQAETKYSYSVYQGETVRKEMLNNAKGKQLYGDAPSLYAYDFKDYEGFIDRGP